MIMYSKLRRRTGRRITCISRRKSGSTVIHCLETADLVTVTTPYLAEALARAVRESGGPDGIPTSVLPNYIPELVLGLERKQRDRPSASAGQAGASHGRDVHLIDPVGAQVPETLPWLGYVPVRNGLQAIPEGSRGPDALLLSGSTSPTTLRPITHRSISISG